MLIHDDTYTWVGWGGKLRLGGGKCRLRVYDLRKEDPQRLTYLRPMIVVVSDVTDSTMSVRSCAGHIATKVTQEFNINPYRMLYIEYYSAKTYGEQNEHLIPERYEAVEFTWKDAKALHPKWRSLTAPILEIIATLTQE